jgi:hypothetical protein
LSEEARLQRLLDGLESAIRRRVLRAALRSPATLFEELGYLNLILELKGRLQGV